MEYKSYLLWKRKSLNRRDFPVHKMNKFWSRPSVFKGKGMCISYSDWAWSWFVSQQKQGIFLPYTISRFSVGPLSIHFIVYGVSYSGYDGLKTNLLHILMLRLIMSEAVLPVCRNACQLFKAKTLIFYFDFNVHCWIGLISIFFICAFYVSPWVSLSWHSEQ